MTLRGLFRRSRPTAPAAAPDVPPGKRALEIVIIGDQGAGKTTFFQALFDILMEASEHLGGCHIKPTRVVEELRGRKYPASTDRDTVLHWGSVQIDGEIMGLEITDTRGGLLTELLEDGSDEEASVRPLSQLTQSCDLLILAVPPEAVQDEDLRNRIFQHMSSHVGLLAANNPHAMIAIAYTKCDEYGHGSAGRARVIRTQGQRRLLQAVSKRPQSKWGAFLDGVQPRTARPVDARRRHVLNDTRFLWGQVLERVSLQRGNVNGYWVTARPPGNEQPGVSGSGIPQILADFFEHHARVHGRPRVRSAHLVGWLLLSASILTGGLSTTLIASELGRDVDAKEPLHPTSQSLLGRATELSDQRERIDLIIGSLASGKVEQPRKGGARRASFERARGVQVLLDGIAEQAWSCASELSDLLDAPHDQEANPDRLRRAITALLAMEDALSGVREGSALHELLQAVTQYGADCRVRIEEVEAGGYLLHARRQDSGRAWPGLHCDPYSPRELESLTGLPVDAPILTWRPDAEPVDLQLHVWDGGEERTFDFNARGNHAGGGTTAIDLLWIEVSFRGEGQTSESRFRIRRAWEQPGEEAASTPGVTTWLPAVLEAFGRPRPEGRAHDPGLRLDHVSGPRVDSGKAAERLSRAVGQLESWGYLL